MCFAAIGFMVGFSVLHNIHFSSPNLTYIIILLAISVVLCSILGFFTAKYLHKTWVNVICSLCIGAIVIILMYYNPISAVHYGCLTPNGGYMPDCISGVSQYGFPVHFRIVQDGGFTGGYDNLSISFLALDLAIYSIIAFVLLLGLRKIFKTT